VDGTDLNTITDRGGNPSGISITRLGLLYNEDQCFYLVKIDVERPVSMAATRRSTRRVFHPFGDSTSPATMPDYIAIPYHGGVTRLFGTRIVAT